MPHSQFPLQKSITTCNQENNAYSKICIKKKIKTILNNNLTKIKSQKKIRINRAVKIIIVTPPPSKTTEKNTYTIHLILFFFSDGLTDFHLKRYQYNNLY